MFVRLALLLVGAGLFGCGPSGPEWLRADVPTSQALWAVHGSGQYDAWASGSNGALLHYDGTNWRAVDSAVPGTLFAVWAVSANEVWAVGESGTVLRGNPAHLDKVAGAPGSTLKHLWADGPTRVWLSTGSATYFYDGAGFTQVTLQQGSSVYYLSVDSFSGNADVGLWMTASGNLYRVLSGQVTLVEPGTADSWRLVVAQSPTNVWVVSDERALRFDGTRWVAFDLPPTWNGASSLGLRAGWSNGVNDTYFVGGYGRVVHYDGQALTLQTEGIAGSSALTGVWGQANDMWASGENGTLLRRVVP